MDLYHLVCWLFENVLLWDFISLFEYETEVWSFPEVLSAWDGPDIFFDGVLVLLAVGWTVSRVGVSVFSTQVNICCVATEVKTGLKILAYFFHIWIIRHRDEFACLMLYNIFSDFIFRISFFFKKNWQSFEEAMWVLTTFGTHRIAATIEALLAFLSRFDWSILVYFCIGLYHVRISDT